MNTSVEQAAEQKYPIDMANTPHVGEAFDLEQQMKNNDRNYHCQKAFIAGANWKEQQGGLRCEGAKRMLLKSTNALFLELPESVAEHNRHLVQNYINAVESAPPNNQQGCGICGGTLVSIRGKYPQGEKRLVCPTCNTERLDQINEISSKSYGVAYQTNPLSPLPEPPK